MQQKYVYAYNGVVNWLRGAIALPQRGAQVIAQNTSSQQLIWRNHFTQSYKVSEGFTQLPMDLSNFLFIRTRESLLLQNKVGAPAKVLRSGKANALTAGVTQKSLQMCNEELSDNLPTLTNTLFVLSPLEGKAIPDLPVAFATNSLYVLEKHGLGDVARDTYSKLLIPILKAKASNLHAEGVAQAVWALANAGLVEDAELWGTLKKIALEKQWTQVIVKNERWSATLFRTQAGNEHFFEGELNEFADQLFFQDHLNLFEAYNGFKKAAALNPKLGLEEVVKAFLKTPVH